MKSGHVAIVNYVTGDRGETDKEKENYRDGEDVWLIQAVSSPLYAEPEGADNPESWEGDIKNGQVTDTWNWDDFKKKKNTYEARRLLP